MIENNRLQATLHTVCSMLQFGLNAPLTLNNEFFNWDGYGDELP